MFRLLFVLFLTVPLLELYVLIRVGSFIGPILTMGLCLLTAALGAGLLRFQGLQTLARIQQKTQAGEVPAVELLEGALLLVSGVLLLTPGFVTDMTGFLCLTPAIRHWAAQGVLKRCIQSAHSQGSRHNIIVEGEFWEEGRQQIDRPVPPEQ